MNEELKRKIRIVVIIYIFFGMAIAGSLQSFNKSFKMTNPVKFETANVMPFYIDLILSVGAVVAAVIQRMRVKGKYIPLFLLSSAVAVFPWYIIKPGIYNKFGFISIVIVNDIEFLSTIVVPYFLYKAFVNEENMIIDKHGRQYTLWDVFTRNRSKREKQSTPSSTTQGPS